MRNDIVSSKIHVADVDIGFVDSLNDTDVTISAATV